MSCLEFYQKLVSEPQLLANGHTLIANYLLESPQNRSETLASILVPSPPVLTLIGNVLPSAVFPLLPEQEKSSIRIRLLQLLFQVVGKSGAASKQSQSLLALIHRIHNEQGYDKWLALYAELIKSLPPQQMGNFLISLLQSADNRICTLAVKIFSYVAQAAQAQSLTHITNEQLLQILYHSVHKFSHLAGTDTQTLQAHFTPHQKWLMHFIWAKLGSTPVCMKYGFKLLTLLYGQLDRFEQEASTNLQKLFEYGIKLAQEYMKLAGDATFCATVEQQQQQENSNELSANLPIILHQLLELLDIVWQKMEESEEHSKQVKNGSMSILIFALLATLPTRHQLQTWYESTDQYVVAVEDQYERSLRNRATALVVSLLEDSQNKQAHIKMVRQYFTTVAASAPNGDVSAVQQFFNKASRSQVGIVLPTDFVLLEESSYRVLASTISSLYSAQQRKQLQQYLLNRSANTKDMLIKIITLYICVSQLRQPFLQATVDAITAMIRSDKTVYSRKQDIGLAIVLARGLGKIASAVEVTLGSNVPLQFIGLLAGYIRSNSNGRPDQDGTYIVLQLLLKLTESNPKNKQVLASVITADLEIFMMHNYMHDGLLSSIVIKLLEQYPHQATVACVANSLMGGHIREEKYSELAAKWMKSGFLSIGAEHVQLLLQLYGPPSHSLITPILRLYLSEVPRNPSHMTPSIRQLLNRNIDEVLLVPMLKCSILNNLEQRLVGTVKNITYEETSQYEIQRKMMLVYYCGIYETARLIHLLKEGHNTLYTDFMDKLLKYARLFNGQNLRVITSILLLKMSEVDGSLSTKIAALLNIYGKVQTNQWEEEQSEQGEQDIIQRLLNCKLQNDQLEKELEEVFPELLTTTAGADYINQKMGHQSQ